jgi:hypothetical protein
MKKQKDNQFSWKSIGKEIKQSGFYFMFLTIICMFMMIGMTMNFLAMTGNGGKMPVLLEYDYSDYDHFSYQNFSEVNYPYYTDIIQIRNSMYSFGDILMLLAIIIAFITAVIKIYKAYKLIRKYLKARDRKNGKKK